MKTLIFLSILIMSTNSFAKLEVVRMSLYGTNPHVSTVTELFGTAVIITKTSNENIDLLNECDIVSDTPGVEKYGGIEKLRVVLQRMMDSKNSYLLSCYTGKNDRRIDDSTIVMAPTIQFQISKGDSRENNDHRMTSESQSLNTGTIQ